VFHGSKLVGALICVNEGKVDGDLSFIREHGLPWLAIDDVNWGAARGHVGYSGSMVTLSG
jgi:hypothetical protein